MNRTTRRAAPRAACIFVLALVFATTAAADSASSSGDQSASAADLPEIGQERAPENPFLRFEIVSLGSYPIVLFYTDLAFDCWRYYEKDFDSSYIPLVSSVSLKDSERWTRLGAALGAACTVGAIDAIIHASKQKAAKRLHAAALEAAAQKAAAQKAAAGDSP
jgi:hypothetical protein